MQVKYFGPDGTDHLVELKDATELPAVDLEAETDARIDRVSWTIWAVGVAVIVLLVLVT